MAAQYYMIRRLLRSQPFYEEFIAKARRSFQDSRAGHNLLPCIERTSFIDENDWAVLKAFDEILTSRMTFTSSSKCSREIGSHDIGQLEFMRHLAP